MVLLRKLLIWLRKNYYKEIRYYALVTSALIVSLSGLSLLVDWLLPFGGLAMLARSALLVPLGLAIFAGFYGASLYLHEVQKASQESWTPYRARFSPRWRLQIAAVGGAVLFVLAYASTRGIGYTLVSSLIASFILVLMAFVRTTREEAKRVDLGVPDARDIAYDARRNAYDRKLAERRALKAQKKKDKS